MMCRTFCHKFFLKLSDSAGDIHKFYGLDFGPVFQPLPGLKYFLDVMKKTIYLLCIIVNICACALLHVIKRH